MKKYHLRESILTILLAVSIMFVISANVSGHAEAATLNHTKAEAVQWCKNKIGKAGVNYDGAYGVQCVDLIREYSAWLGKDLGIAQGNGAAYNYASQNIPGSYYTRYSNQTTPAPGDIFVWAANAYGAGGAGHVGVIYEVGANYYKYIDYNSGNNGEGPKSTTKKDGVKNFTAIIRPNFKPANYKLDVDVKADGKTYTSGFNGVTFDVYIGGTLKSNDTKDYSASHNSGTSYQIKDIKISGCYANAGNTSFNGTLNADAKVTITIKTQHTSVAIPAVAATCTSEGLSAGSKCSKCGTILKQQTVSSPALGHDYQLTNTKAATCTEDAVHTYTCSRCGSTTQGSGDTTTYGEWSVEKPAAGKNQTVETKTQYRSAVRKDEWQQSGSGTIDYAASWTAGFNKSHSLYTKYNVTPKTASETSTQKVTVSTSNIGYIYYHWCMGRTDLEQPYNRTIESNKTNTHSTFHAFYSTTDLALDKDANARKLSNKNYCKDTYWWLNERITIKRCSYTTYTKAATGDWGAWSSWQDQKITSTDSRKVETRTLYRLKTVTPGKATGHNYGAWKKQADGTYKRVCKNDASHFETKEALSVKDEENRILNDKSDEAPANSSSFGMLQLRYTKASKSYIKVKWTKVKGAASYYLYGARCGKVYEKLGAFKKQTYKASGLKKGKYYKFYVIAADAKGNILAQSKTIHVATTGGKIGNYGSVKLKNVKGKTLKIKKGKSFKIKASAVAKNKKLKVSKHRNLAFESSNPKVVKVSSKGKITAKKAGTAKIYVYSQSGTFAVFKVKVTK